ncbi:MAG TPA: hypothetical protein VGK47_12340, partial [Nitrososphaeraceae archaeon]
IVFGKCIEVNKYPFCPHYASCGFSLELKKYAREKIKAKQGNESHNIYDAISQSMCYLEAE